MIAGIEADSEWQDRIVDAARRLVQAKQVEQASVDIVVVDYIEEDGDLIDPQTGEVMNNE